MNHPVKAMPHHVKYYTTWIDVQLPRVTCVIILISVISFAQFFAPTKHKFVFITREQKMAVVWMGSLRIMKNVEKRRAAKVEYSKSVCVYGFNETNTFYFRLL